MKLLNVCLVGASLALSSPALAQTSAKGGFSGPGATTAAPLKTVDDVLKNGRDEQPCELEGRIVSRAPGDDENYVFRDSTGEIIVDIDDDLFAGRKVTPNTRVRLYGEIDTHLSRQTSVDVKRLETVDILQETGNEIQGFFEDLFEN